MKTWGCFYRPLWPDDFPLLCVLGLLAAATVWVAAWVLIERLV